MMARNSIPPSTSEVTRSGLVAFPGHCAGTFLLLLTIMVIPMPLGAADFSGPAVRRSRRARAFRPKERLISCDSTQVTSNGAV